MDPQPTLADELQRLMRKYGYSHGRLTDEARVPLSRTTAYRWINGISKEVNNPDQLAVIADTLQLKRIETERLARAGGLGGITDLLSTQNADVRALARRWEHEYRHTLPAPVSRFVGREADVRAVAERLGVWDQRLVTIDGTAGSGKTRLALEAARWLTDAFPDGLFLITLADLSSADAVAPAIVRALGIIGDAGAEPLVRLQSFLRERRLLLLLDNFEHVLAARLMLAQLLEAAPRLQVLVTSQTPLELRGEVRWPLESLTLPQLNATPQAALHSDAVALFQERARAVRPVFSVSSANVADVCRLCHDLDGLPLAIELVAAQVGRSTPRDLLAGFNLADALDVAGPVDADPRQRTLRRSIDWSYRRLAEPDALLLRRLGVFRGGWVLADAGAICGFDRLDVAAGLQRLGESHLVERSGERYRLLETIREFARDLLAGTPEGVELPARHATHFAASVAQAGHYYPMSSQGEWMERLEPEQANVEVALAWLAQHDPLGALRFAAGLWPYWHEYEHAPVGLRHLPAAIAAVPDAPPELLAMAHSGLLYCAFSISDYATARNAGEHALRLWRDLADPYGQGLTLLYLGQVYGYTGDPAAAFSAYAEATRLFESSGDSRGLAICCNNIAQAQVLAGQPQEAHAFFVRAEQLWKALGDPIGLLRVTADRGFAELVAGHPNRTIHLLRNIVDNMPRERSTGIHSAVEFFLGVAYTLENKLDDALRLQTRSITSRWEGGDTLGLSFNILAFASIAMRRALLLPPGDPARAALAERAAELAGAAVAIQSNSAISVPGAREIYERELAMVQQELGPESFAQVFSSGMALSPARAYALCRELAAGDQN